MTNPSVSKPFALYRCTNVGDTESNLPDGESIGCDYGIQDTSVIAVQEYPLTSSGRKTDVPTPTSQGANKPDTGNQGITVPIKFIFNQDSALNNFVGTLLKWQMDFQNSPATTANPIGGFNRGRFGLRSDDNPWFNFQPTINSGWKIIDVTCNDLIEFGNVLEATVTLQWWGRIPDLIAAIEANGG